MTVSACRGNWIDHRYQVVRVLGEGGFGVVYLVHDHETNADFALKTFRDEYLLHQDVRDRFRREAEIWIGLDRYPYLVNASRIEEIHGRLYVAMDYVAPGADGINSFETLLRRKPPAIADALVWAIQFCIGMTHAYSKGLRAHRDIKPSNMLLDSSGTVRISDFGIASAVRSPARTTSVGRGVVSDTRWRSRAGSVIGTPPYMAPEQFVDSSSCDERSDIYSFGVVLFQFAARGDLPFTLPSAGAGTDLWHHLHATAPVPRIDSPLFPVLSRCLEKDTSRRYPSFDSLRRDLAALLKRIAGREVVAPAIPAWEAWEWNNKGAGLIELGKADAAVDCFDKALELAPWFVGVWNNRGVALSRLGREEDAVQSFERAISLDRAYAPAWTNLGNAFRKLRRFRDAERCHSEALRLAPDSPEVWANQGNHELECERLSAAAECYRHALTLDPGEPGVLCRLGLVLHGLGRGNEAISLYEAALQRDPLQPMAWVSLGSCLSLQGRHADALAKIERALGIDPDLPMGWFTKAGVLGELGRSADSVAAYAQFLGLAGPEYSEEIQFAQQIVGNVRHRDERRSTGRLNILLLANDAELAEVVAGPLREQALTVVNTPLEAAALLAKRHFKFVILTNFGLSPEQALGAVPEDHNYPVLLLTGVVTPDVVRLCERKRVHYRTIPIDPIDLSVLFRELSLAVDVPEIRKVRPRAREAKAVRSLEMAEELVKQSNRLLERREWEAAEQKLRGAAVLLRRHLEASPPISRC